MKFCQPSGRAGLWSRGRVVAHASVLGLVLLALTSCAAPLVHPNLPTFQYKAEHASDWQRLAVRAVERLPSSQLTSKPRVFVAPGPSDMPFAMAYRQYLEQSLSEHGFQVMESSADAVVLNFNVQTFLYGNWRGNEKRLVDYASFYTSVYAVGSQLRHISSYDTAVGAGAVAGPIFDVLAAMNDTTRAEVVLTVSVQDDSRLHYINSESFYVQPTDLPFYWSQLPANAPQTMRAEALPVVSLPVVKGYR
ncbi:MAG TPA: hypothetical protein VG407_03190 [Caulobacteraceae bacterium]|jgi:hypothetical protein|nr:hypothetical protein [Caulobacteraceae bacterium]